VRTQVSFGPDFISIMKCILSDTDAAKLWAPCQDEKSQRYFDLKKKVVRDRVGASHLLDRSLNVVPVTACGPRLELPGTQLTKFKMLQMHTRS